MKHIINNMFVYHLVLDVGDMSCLEHIGGKFKNL